VRIADERFDAAILSGDAIARRWARASGQPVEIMQQAVVGAYFQNLLPLRSDQGVPISPVELLRIRRNVPDLLPIPLDLDDDSDTEISDELLLASYAKEPPFTAKAWKLWYGCWLVSRDDFSTWYAGSSLSIGVPLTNFWSRVERDGVASSLKRTAADWEVPERPAPHLLSAAAPHAGAGGGAVMPFASEDERTPARQMTWSELLKCVRSIEQCDEREAQCQIGLANADDWLIAQRDDGLPVPDGALTADYWARCQTDLADPDRVLDPPLREAGFGTAKRLERRRCSWKPLFARARVIKFWQHVWGLDKARRWVTWRDEDGPAAPADRRFGTLAKIDDDSALLSILQRGRIVACGYRDNGVWQEIPVDAWRACAWTPAGFTSIVVDAKSVRAEFGADHATEIVNRNRREFRQRQIDRFEICQHRKRQWIRFSEIADWCAREPQTMRSDGSWQAVAYQKLRKALLAGEFGRGDQARVLYLQADLPKNLPESRRMTPASLRKVVMPNDPTTLSEVLANCWLQRDQCQVWLRAEGIEPKPGWCFDTPTPANQRISSPELRPRNDKVNARKPAREKPFWPDAEREAKAWLVDNGFPEKGDGGQAKLESHIASWLSDRGHIAGESTIRLHIAHWIDEYRKALEAE